MLRHITASRLKLPLFAACAAAPRCHCSLAIILLPFVAASIVISILIAMYFASHFR